MPFDGTNFEQDDVRDALCRARDLVARHGGWCQGVIQNDSGAVCLLGAIHAAAPGFAERNLLTREESWRAVTVLLPERDGIMFNDAPGRTQAEIVALFDRAIAKREALGIEQEAADG